MNRIGKSRDFYRYRIIRYTITNYSLYTSSKAALITPPTKEKNDKAFHASLLFRQWYERKTPKRIYSNRLGISYTSTIHANGRPNILCNKTCTSMYRKCLENLEFRYSNNARTRRKQETRFKRHCDGIFNKHAKDPNRFGLTDSACRRHRFLFHPGQFINKPISHVKYLTTAGSLFVNADDYDYPIPFFFFRNDTRRKIISKFKKFNRVVNTLPVENLNTGVITASQHDPTQSHVESRADTDNDETEKVRQQRRNKKKSLANIKDKRPELPASYYGTTRIPISIEMNLFIFSLIFSAASTLT
jgi:hypothetical protein